jgi:uncharacterized membrane protein YkoI
VNRRTAAVCAALVTAALGAVGIANAADGAGAKASGQGASASRLDDGKDLLPQATITEQQAIEAAQAAASGALGEVDLEHYGGRLVFNVDVGAKDVKVDATTGDVLAAPADD